MRPSGKRSAGERMNVPALRFLPLRWRLYRSDGVLLASCSHVWRAHLAAERMGLKEYEIKEDGK